MTLNAVNSFIAATPAVSVGLLFPHGFNTSSTLNQIKDASRVSVRNYEQQFANWNPTQHKLDIQKFADQFETIFWMDSDAIVYKDLTDLLLEFNQSACKVAFMKDHVCWNPQFLNAWSEFRHRTDPFVPQASFMGFKRDIIQSFFAEWKETWRQWIEPTPFTIYPNPLLPRIRILHRTIRAGYGSGGQSRPSSYRSWNGTRWCNCHPQLLVRSQAFILLHV